MALHRQSGAAASILAATLFLWLAGCEEHKSTAIRSAPEHLHDALSGDINQQASLAKCYDMAGECADVSADPAMACAWRGVRLASRSPKLSLSDSEEFSASCGASDEAFRQRASIALIDLGSRVYGRKVGPVDQMMAAIDPHAVLYPSINTVRERVNLALAQNGNTEQLPRFAPRRPVEGDEPVAWSSCGPTVCLEGFTPAFGGGVVSYRVTVKSSTASPSQVAALAAKLAVAGLEAPSAADALSAAPAAQVMQGPVCWIKGQGIDGLSYAGAARAPCRPVAAWSGS